MNHDDLLAYYQQELTLLRQLGAEFSQAHPKIAGRLRLGAKMVEDPHVARLLEAFAFLTAHVHAKLDDDFPAISDALLEVLYPNYLAPLPALSIAHLQIDIEKLTGLKTIAKNTLLVSDSSYGESCFFRTCYPVELWPIKVIDANVNSSPAVLRLRLGCTKDKLVFAGFELDKLRFFIHAAPQQAYALYQLLFNHVRAITLAESTQDKNPISLDKSCLRQVGFDEDNNLLPYNSRIFMGHRLLTEFFALPEKFLFFELVDLKDKIKNKFIKENQNLEIYLYLGKIDTGLEKSINADNFILNCAPVVNIFPRHAEPFYLTPTQSEYHLVPDAQRLPFATEIYSIQRVTASIDDGRTVEYRPFYGLNYADNVEETIYYHATRKPADQGTEVFLSFNDLYCKQIIDEKWVVSAEVLCTNRDLPSRLPFGNEDPRLSFHETKLDGVASIKCLIPITAARRPILQQGARWCLLSHLSLNHLSLTDDESGIAALRELLQLYDFSQSDEHRNLLQGLLRVKSRRITARNPQARRGNVFWQGTEITLEVDESKFTGTSLFLFGSILERFFALYCTINSFTQLIITTRQRGELYRWPPRAGDKVLI